MLVKPITLSASEKPEVHWRFFFGYFFHFLLAFLSLSQWGCVLWGWIVLVNPTVPLTPLWHISSLLVLYTVNLFLVTSLRQISSLSTTLQLSLRVYFAWGFTSMFGFLFLLLSGGAWGSLWLVCQTVGVAIAGVESEIAATGAFLWRSFRWVTIAGMSLIVSTFFYGYTLGQKRMSITRFTLPLHNLPPELDGLTLAHISDLHIGPNLEEAALCNYVDQVNALKPDLILITGDIFDSRHSDIPKYSPILGKLRARYGVFAVLGNHDCYAGATAVEEGLRRYTGITLLRDQHVAAAIKGHLLHLLGVDDLGHDWARGLESHPILSQLLTTVPSGQPTILLSHRPDLFVQAARAGIGLTLSGHTHGGQLALPRFWGKRNLNLACLITAFSRGLYEQKGVFLYVNRGLGVTGQRIRLFTPREIALITLSANWQSLKGRQWPFSCW